MTNRSLSDRVKRLKRRRADEYKLKQAILEYQAERAKPKEDRLGGRDIAQKHGVKHRTLMYHVEKEDAPTISAFNASKQKLSVAEERVLVDFIKDSADHGFPLTHRAIKSYANAALQSRLGAELKPVGKQWIFRFLDRHHEEIQTHWSKPLDMQRAKCLNPEAVKSWFDLAKKYIVDLGIPPENIYGMDESGFPPANQGPERVVGQRGTKTQHKQGGADRENVTALVTICADGTTLTPMIIYKGANFMTKWGQDNIARAT
jgi:hypothetical protein